MHELSRNNPQPDRLVVFVLLFVLGATLGVNAKAQVLMQPNLSASQAQQVVAAIVAECSLPGDLLTVTVAVVDRAGLPIMQLRADTASPHNYELAFRKAYTARTFRRTSIDFRDRTANGAENEGQRSLSNIIALGGGVPIMLGDVPIGAVGVSGAGGGQPADTACAEAGIAAIADDFE